MNADRLLAHYERIADAPHAIARLRRFILGLAVRGKLVQQDANDEPASELLKRIAKEKARLVKAGEIRKPPALEPITDAEALFGLPRTWAWVRVGDIFDYDAGTKRDPKELNKSRWLLELEDIEKDTSRIVERLRVSDRDPQSTKSEFEPGDILYGKLRPYLNKVVVADEPGYSTTEIVAIRPFLRLCPEYCALAFRRPDFVAYVERLGRGTKMPRLRTPDAIVAPFPFPPLAEQHRIVAKVDELMGLCDRLEATRAGREAVRDRLALASLARLNAPDPETFEVDARFALDALPALTTRPDQIKTLRQTILNLAVRGKLVPQDPKDEPASELLKRIAKEKARLVKSGKVRDAASIKVDQIDANGLSLPSSWEYVTVAEVAYLRSGVALAHDEEQPAGDIPYVKVADLGLAENRRGVVTSSRFVASNRDDDAIEVGSIVFPKRGGAIATNRKRLSLVRIVGDSNLMAMKPYSDDTRPFIELWFSSFDLWTLNSGTSVPQINNKDIYPLALPLPPLAEQLRIVAKVDALMALCDRLEASLAATAATRRRLLDALLAEALAPADDRELEAAE